MQSLLLREGANIFGEKFLNSVLTCPFQENANHPCSYARDVLCQELWRGEVLPHLLSHVLYIYDYYRSTSDLGQGKEFFIDIHNQFNSQDNTAAFVPHMQTHRQQE